VGAGVTPELRAALRVVVDAYPPGSTVPVLRELALELLAGNGAAEPTPAADLTVADLCLQFGRKASAVRAWLERGDFAGAYKLQGRDWRVPPAAVEAYRSRQQQAAGKQQSPTAGTAGDLSAWRRARQSRA
jgi:hypothetical protein